MSELELITAAEVAERAGVAVKTVHRWAESGRIKTAMQGPGLRGARFFRPKDVERLLAELQTERSA